MALVLNILDIINSGEKQLGERGDLPVGDMNSAFFLNSTLYGRLQIFKKVCTAKQFALSASKICSTSYGMNSLVSGAQSSCSGKMTSSVSFIVPKQKMMQTRAEPDTAYIKQDLRLA